MGREIDDCDLAKWQQDFLNNCKRIVLVSKIQQNILIKCYNHLFNCSAIALETKLITLEARATHVVYTIEKTVVYRLCSFVTFLDQPICAILHIAEITEENHRECDCEKCKTPVLM